jgi:hypothetical protein
MGQGDEGHHVAVADDRGIPVGPQQGLSVMKADGRSLKLPDLSFVQPVRDGDRTCHGHDLPPPLRLERVIHHDDAGLHYSINL